MAYVLDSSAILSVLLLADEADEVINRLRAASKGEDERVVVPFTVMNELELYLIRHLPDEVDQALALVEGWPVEIVESFPQWRREVVRLLATLDIEPNIAWPAALALVYNAKLVHQDTAFDVIPGLDRITLI